MFTAHTGLAALLLILMAGCASNKELAKRTEFKTRITDTGLKHFQLSLKRQRRDEPPAIQRGAPARSAPQRPTRRGGRAQEKQLMAILETRLADSQFCREGHWIIDKSLIRANTFIRGECNETATASDRSNFPDTLTYW